MPVHLFGYYHETRVREVFDSIDKDSNGKLSFSEIKAGLEGDAVDWEQCGLDSSTVMEAIYREADADGEKTLTFEQFWKFATVHGKGRHAEDPSEQVRDYVDRHDLLAVMEQSLAALLYSKPEDPKAFLSNYLGILKKAGRKETSFFTDDDLGIVFGLFDLTGKGVMAPKQFANALKNLGIERAPAIERPISKERFVQLARAALDAL